MKKKSKYYFVPGIILDHFRHPKSIFGIENLKIYENLQENVFDLKINFLIKKSISRFKKT